MKKFYRWDHPFFPDYDAFGIYDEKEEAKLLSCGVRPSEGEVNALMVSGFGDENRMLKLYALSTKKKMVAPLFSFNLAFRSTKDGHPVKGEEIILQNEESYSPADLKEGAEYHEAEKEFCLKWIEILKTHFVKKDALNMLHEAWNLGYDLKEPAELMKELTDQNRPYERTSRKRLLALLEKHREKVGKEG